MTSSSAVLGNLEANDFSDMKWLSVFVARNNADAMSCLG